MAAFVLVPMLPVTEPEYIPRAFSFVWRSLICAALSEELPEEEYDGEEDEEEDEDEDEEEAEDAEEDEAAAVRLKVPTRLVGTSPPDTPSSLPLCLKAP